MKSVKIWQAAGFAVTGGLGVFLHFLYDKTGMEITALFSAVNESTWEHMKLLFFPALLFAAAEWIFIGRIYANFLCIKLKGMLSGLILIPVLFYTAKGAFGDLADFVNIIIFFVAVGAMYIFETKLFKKGSTPCHPVAAGLILIGISAFFFVFTFAPPKIPLFMDPITKTFGI